MDTKVNQATELQTKVFLKILEERKRQDRLWGDQRSLPDATWVMIAAEEFGESVKSLNEDHQEHATIELIQTAAVIVAWLEARLSKNTDDQLAL